MGIIIVSVFLLSECWYLSRFCPSGEKYTNTKYRPVCFFFFFSFWFSNFQNWASIWKRDKIQAGQSGSNYRHMFHCQQECTILLHNIDSACGWKINNKTSKVFQKYLAIANQVFWGTQANLTLSYNQRNEEFGQKLRHCGKGEKPQSQRKSWFPELGFNFAFIFGRGLALICLISPLHL